jgi:hypothetical protein
VDPDAAAEIAMVSEAAAATNALHAGARSPTFALQDTLGRRVALDQLLRAARGNNPGWQRTRVELRYEVFWMSLKCRQDSFAVTRRRRSTASRRE